MSQKLQRDSVLKGKGITAQHCCPHTRIQMIPWFQSSINTTATGSQAFCVQLPADWCRYIYSDSRGRLQAMFGRALINNDGTKKKKWAKACEWFLIFGPDRRSHWPCRHTQWRSVRRTTALVPERKSPALLKTCSAPDGTEHSCTDRTDCCLTCSIRLKHKALIR